MDFVIRLLATLFAVAICYALILGAARAVGSFLREAWEWLHPVEKGQ